ncbi:MAG TPA: ABC transporter permease [Candidatus Acidoferrum sp.]|nr:ABC transporter permease [Candidatus Acidoferrum sp.]
MRGMLKDFRFAFRTLVKHPAFAFIAVVTLALGMAVNSTVFAVVNGFLLRPLPVAHPEEITVLALQQSQSVIGGTFRFSHPVFAELQGQSDSFSDIFAYHVTLSAVSVDHLSDHCLIGRVSSNYFSALGIKPAYGRLILPTEGLTPGADPVLVLGYPYWRRRFAANPNVMGQKVEISNHPFTVIGVAPPEFHGTYSALDMDGYVPLSAQTDDDQDQTVQKEWASRVVRNLTIMGRLKPGVSLKQAQSSLNVVVQRIAQAHPEAEKGISVRVFPEKLARPEPDPENSVPAAAVAFMCLAALVLLVACFNIANVLLVRATVRQREMAIRAALGAGRGRLVAQYLTESLVLALLGGAAGLLLASWAAGFLSSLSLGTDLPIRLDFRPDARVYAYSLAAILLTGLLVGIMPALRAARTNVISVLHEGGRGSSSGPRRQFARNALVVAQVAGSLVLLIVAGLFIRSLGKAEKINLGFNPDHVLDLSVDVAQVGYQEAQARQAYQDMDARIRTLPGVQSVAQCFTVPLGYIGAGERVWIAEHPYEAGQQPADVSNNLVTPGYLDTLQIPLLRGRKFSEEDKQKAPPVAIINLTMAKKFWPNEDALGKHFGIKGPSGPFLEVVGIAQDGKYQGVTEDPQPFFYLPIEQSFVSLRTIHVRTTVPPESLALQIQSLIHEVVPGVPITQVETMTEALQGANGFFLFRFGVQLTSTMGLLGLILAVVGIYSVVSYAAAQRTQEIGIRIAMGASTRDILKMVLRQALTVVGIGLAAGVLLAFAGTSVMSGLFVGIKATDPLTFALVISLLTAIALLACWIPARRATRIDPLVALRYE